MNSSLLASESVFVDFETDFSHAEQSHELESLTWAQLISKDTETQNESLASSSEVSSLNSTKFDSVPITHCEAMRLLNLAASLLQANIKRYFQQRRYKTFLKQHKAAIKIQALWKGYKTRVLNIKLLHQRHELLVKNLQQSISNMDEKYSQKIKSIETDKKILLEILTTLTNQMQQSRISLPTIDKATQAVEIQHLQTLDSPIQSVDTKSESITNSAVESINVKSIDTTTQSVDITHSVTQSIPTVVITTQEINHTLRIEKSIQSVAGVISRTIDAVSQPLEIKQAPIIDSAVVTQSVELDYLPLIDSTLQDLDVKLPVTEAWLDDVDAVKKYDLVVTAILNEIIEDVVKQLST